MTKRPQYSAEANRKRSIAIKKLWNDPKYKAKNSKGRSKRAKQIWADPISRY